MGVAYLMCEMRSFSIDDSTPPFILPGTGCSSKHMKTALVWILTPQCISANMFRRNLG